jgi:hypothetical protein
MGVANIHTIGHILMIIKINFAYLGLGVWEIYSANNGMFQQETNITYGRLPSKLFLLKM